MTREEGREKVRELVASFEDRERELRRADYLEAQVRLQFLDGFFEALGWDIHDYREVTVEKAQGCEDGRKGRADYSFHREPGRPLFFAEAKKPSENLEKNKHHAVQARRYAYSADHPVVILTDFDEFYVYKGRGIEPKENDDAKIAIIDELSCKTCHEYPEKWDVIWGAFSRESVLAGSLEKIPGVVTDKKGTMPVDQLFLSDIEKWRKLLAENIHANNPDLPRRTLNEVVQKTIDRIIFLRICEDREIEEYGQIREAGEKGEVYKSLCELFKKADTRYNSGLFHFKKETGREKFDADSLNLAIDNDPLQKIIGRMYWPGGPYAFAVMPADILGQVYERFLGKVIEIGAAGVTVEDKPEVKKAGGVFYTPAYIVDYIAKNTVGRLLGGKKPEDAAKIRILDPACGSGAFLINAYQRLLDWHLTYYTTTKKPETWKKEKRLIKDVNGAWRLALVERKRILINNIFGVDIDSQAVEVTRLSLLLKCLEGETKYTAQIGIFDAHERVLPDLDKNIKCGNSLIGRNFYDEKQTGLFDREQKIKINVFDWNTEFKTILDVGGFDAVIGNPPYIRIQVLKEWLPETVEHYKLAYLSAAKGNYDIYVTFVEKGLQLLNSNGWLGFILPHKFFNAQYGEPLRRLIANGMHLSEVVHFGDKQIFSGASTYTCLLFLGKARRDEFCFEKVDDLEQWQIASISRSVAAGRVIPATSVTAGEWNFSTGDGGLFERLSAMPETLETVTDRIFQGIKTSADKIYIVEELERTDEKIKVYSREKEAEYWLEHHLLHPLIKGGDSRRYALSRTNRLILFPYAQNENGKMDLIAADSLSKSYPLTWQYFCDNREYLENRENGKMRNARWFGYIYPKALDVMPLSKIFTPDIAPDARYSLDVGGDAFFTGGAAGGYGILVKPEYCREYLLGLLNSSLLEWFNKQIATQMRGGWFSFEARFIRKLPIRTINFDDPADKKLHDDMVKLVEDMLGYHKELQKPGLDSMEKRSIEQDIADADHRIDVLVYQLYGLDETEVRVVEGA